MKKVFFSVIIGILWIGPSHGLSVVATTSQIGDALENIVGAAGEVVTLMGSEVDPHLYRPTRSDMVSLLRADAIFYNGFSLEGQMEDVFRRLSAVKPVRAVAETLDSSKYLSDPEKRFDPHIWMDVAIWSEVVRLMARTLIEIDPDNAAIYRRNADLYRRDLAALHENVQDILERVPPHGRVMVTAHDAFRYFGRAYGFRVIGIQGISTESEAGLKRMEQIVNLLVTEKVNAVFVETSVSERNVRALIEGAARRGHHVRIGGRLFSDAMGAKGTKQGTYIGMMIHNATTISRALGDVLSWR